jgi:hypothetical protein
MNAWREVFALPQEGCFRLTIEGRRMCNSKEDCSADYHQIYVRPAAGNGGDTLNRNRPATGTAQKTANYIDSNQSETHPNNSPCPQSASNLI